MATLFIADLHLSEQEPAITAGFLSFLQQQAINADALYILGDLFEVWIGDDDPNPLHSTVAIALQQLTQQGIPVYFIHGNRDFLLGSYFAKQSGMQLLPQQQYLTLYDVPTLIMHGDTLCTDDLSYQRFRRRVHNPLLQWLFKKLPLSFRVTIAAKMRQQSQLSNQCKSEELMDVNQQAVAEVMTTQQVTQLIHGHTHRPAIHHFPLGEQTATRAVLGAWHHQGSVLIVTQQGFQLHAFPLVSPAE